MSKNKFFSFLVDGTGAGWETVSASDHQAAVEDGTLEWGSVQSDDGAKKIFIALKPKKHIQGMSIMEPIELYKRLATEPKNEWIQIPAPKVLKEILRRLSESAGTNDSEFMRQLLIAEWERQQLEQNRHKE